MIVSFFAKPMIVFRQSTRMIHQWKSWCCCKILGCSARKITKFSIFIWHRAIVGHNAKEFHTGTSSGTWGECDLVFTARAVRTKRIYSPKQHSTTVPTNICFRIPLNINTVPITTNQARCRVTVEQLDWVTFFWGKNGSKSELAEQGITALHSNIPHLQTKEIDRRQV
jgi:hypothetical protein